jgi:hypothetical protein
MHFEAHQGNMANYNHKKFKVLQNSPNGEISGELIFHYQQTGNIVTCEYAGSSIVKGHLIGLVDANGHIDIRYHQVNDKGELQTGICHSTPEILPNGKIRLHETWQWTSSDHSHGSSVLEEI